MVECGRQSYETYYGHYVAEFGGNPSKWGDLPQYEKAWWAAKERGE